MRLNTLSNLCFFFFNKTATKTVNILRSKLFNVFLNALNVRFVNQAFMELSLLSY